MKRLNKTESAVFLYCRFSLFLKDPFFKIILGKRTSSHIIHGNVRFSLKIMFEIKLESCTLFLFML